MAPQVRYLLLLAAAMFSLCGCGESRQSNRLSLLWVQPARDHPVHRLMQAGFLDNCRQLNYDCEIVGNASAANYDVAATIPLADAALARRRFDAVAVYTSDPAINGLIKRLGRNGIPVVTWHVIPKPSATEGLRAATGGDTREAGRAAGILMGETLDGEGVVAVTQAQFNATENQMAEAFNASLREHFPHLKVLAPQLEGLEPAAARAKAIGILQSDANIVGAFSTTGYGAQTWVSAKAATGRKLQIISMDYTRQNLDFLKRGEVLGIIAQPLYEEGRKVADLGAALARGENIPFAHPLPAPVLRASDVEPYYRLLEAAGQ
jgi:ribose transport system substrate-binding protein